MAISLSVTVRNSALDDAFRPANIAFANTKSSRFTKIYGNQHYFQRK